MSGPQTPPPGAPGEEELRAAYEAELARITATDMIAQAAVSLLNIGARRMGPPPAPPGAEAQAPPGSERDLEQARDAIDAARALLGILERRIGAEELRPLRDALSRLQMAYAAEVGAAGAEEEGEEGSGGSDQEGPGGPGGGGPRGGPGPEPAPGGEGEQPGPGPAESSGRLWVPGR